MTELASNKDHLRAVLGFHGVPGKEGNCGMKTGNLKTVQGANLPLARAVTFLTADAGLVTKADVVAGNGVVHATDTVPMPSSR